MVHYDFNWAIITTQPYASMIGKGIAYTLAIALASSALSFVLGSMLALLRVSRLTVARHVANAWVELVRNIPGLFWILFFYFALPELLPPAIGEQLHQWDYYVIVAAVLGLTIDNAAYLSDILRSGILAVPPGQREAATSTGFSPWQECYWVVCPQSLRSVLPAIINRMVHNFKNSSLCIAISVPELTWATQQIESITFRGLEVTAFATLFYVIGSLSISYGLAFWFNRNTGTKAHPSPAHHVARAY